MGRRKEATENAFLRFCVRVFGRGRAAAVGAGDSLPPLDLSTLLTKHLFQNLSRYLKN
jgi:hypothetical protein